MADIKKNNWSMCRISKMHDMREHCMSSTTMGVRLDEETRNRLKDAAQKLDRTSHWLIKQAISHLFFFF